MAGMDYKWCSLCACKVFYDADVNYAWNTGVCAALCKSCVVTHRLVAQPRKDKTPRNSVEAR